MPPPLTEEEIDQMLRVQPPSKPSCKQKILVPSPTKSIYHKLESELVDQFKTDNPICLIGETTYFDEFPKFDQSDDDILQTGNNLAHQSIIGLWEEDHFHQLQKSIKPIHGIYATDEGSLESSEVSKGYLTLCSTSYQPISNNFHVIGNHHYFSFDVEIGKEMELLEQFVS